MGCQGEGGGTAGVCYPVRSTTFKDPVFDDDYPGFVLDVDAEVVGVQGFVVRVGDDVAGLLGIR